MEREPEKAIFTSLVRAKGHEKYKVVPVKSSSEVDIVLWTEISKVISRIYVSIPIRRGSIICRNILNSGVDIICTRDIFEV